jgi:hypothetical protein
MMALSVKLRRSNIAVVTGGIPDIDRQATDASPGANGPKRRFAAMQQFASYPRWSGSSAAVVETALLTQMRSV